MFLVEIASYFFVNRHDNNLVFTLAINVLRFIFGTIRTQQNPRSQWKDLNEQSKFGPYYAIIVKNRQDLKNALKVENILKFNDYMSPTADAKICMVPRDRIKVHLPQKTVFSFCFRIN